MNHQHVLSGRRRKWIGECDLDRICHAGTSGGKPCSSSLQHTASCLVSSWMKDAPCRRKWKSTGMWVLGFWGLFFSWLHHTCNLLISLKSLWFIAYLMYRSKTLRNTAHNHDTSGLRSSDVVGWVVSAGCACVRCNHREWSRCMSLLFLFYLRQDLPLASFSFSPGYNSRLSWTGILVY